MIDWKPNRYGGDVATILDQPDQIVEVMKKPNGAFDLIIHNRNDETGLWDDMTAVLRPEHFVALGEIAGEEG